MVCTVDEFTNCIRLVKNGKVVTYCDLSFRTSWQILVECVWVKLLTCMQSTFKGIMNSILNRCFLVACNYFKMERIMFIIKRVLQLTKGFHHAIRLFIRNSENPRTPPPKNVLYSEQNSWSNYLKCNIFEEILSKNQFTLRWWCPNIS